MHRRVNSIALSTGRFELTSSVLMPATATYREYKPESSSSVSTCRGLLYTVYLIIIVIIILLLLLIISF